MAAGGIELIDGGGVKSAHVAKFCGVAVDEGWNRSEPGCTVGARCVVMGSQDYIGNGNREGWIDRPGGSDTVERLLLIEPHHFDRPFDRGTRSVDFKSPVGIARNSNNAAVELRRIAGVDLQFLLAGALALLQRRIVEEGQPNGALDLQCAVAAEKYHGGMGVDALAALCRTKAGPIEEIEHALLIDLGRYGSIDRLLFGHGCSTAAPVTCPARNFERTSFASRNGNTLVCVLMPACAATSKNSIPSLRVRLATESNCRSSQRI